jgi:hypothetical protein
MKRFPDRQVPCPRTFLNAVQHLRDYAILVLSCPVDEEPNVSCRRLELRIDVSGFIASSFTGHLKEIVYETPETPVNTETIR